VGEDRGVLLMCLELKTPVLDMSYGCHNTGEIVKKKPSFLSNFCDQEEMVFLPFSPEKR